MPRKKRTLYYRIYLYLTLGVVGSLIITSTVLYFNFEKIALEQVYSRDMDFLLQAERGVSSMTDLVKTVSNQIYSDLNVAKLRYYAKPSMESLRIANDQLTNYRLSLPFIDSVYIYNSSADLFYINTNLNRNVIRESIQQREHFDDPFIASIISNIHDYKPFVPIPRIYKPESNENIAENYYTFILYDAYMKEGIDSVVVVNISEPWVTDFINEKNKESGGQTFMIDEEGRVISSTGFYPMQSDLSSLEYIEKIQRNEHSGTLINIISGRKYLTTYTAKGKSGTRFIKVTPWEIVFSNIERMKLSTIIVSALLLLAGVILSFAASRRLYLPIRTLVQEKKKNLKLLKTLYLRDLLLGRGYYDEQSIHIKNEELGMSLDIDGHNLLMLMSIDRYASFSQNYTAAERGIFKGEIIEKSSEYLSGGCCCEIFEMGNDGIAVLLNSPAKSIDFAPQILKERIMSLQKSLWENMELTVSLTVSEEFVNLMNLSQRYSRVVEAALYKLFEGHNSIIRTEEVQKRQTDGYIYPVQKEKLLISALLTGKIDTAEKLYREIVNGTKDFMINVFNLTLSRLTFAVDEALMTIKRSNAAEEVPALSLSLAALSRLETLDDVEREFFHVFEDAGLLLSSRRNDRKEELITSIDGYIEENFPDPRMYIESIAEYLSKSPNYISHLYKQFRGKTVLDRIVEVRMNKARDLLTESEDPVSDIAEKCGFSSSSYFFKVFKKINGVTPNSFRKNYKKIRMG